VVKILLDNGADVNATTNDDNGWTALMIAADRNHEDVVEILLDKGADVNATDKHDQTALMKAASKGHVAVENLINDFLNPASRVTTEEASTFMTSAPYREATASSIPIRI